jgi:hypothetical protein
VHRFRLRGIRISPALVISMLALFVALSGTGLAASIVPLAKRALTADSAKTAKRAKLADTAKVAANSFKVGGQTPDQIAQTPGPATDLGGQTAAQIAATPGPASSVPTGLFTLRSVGWSIQNEDDKTDARALCVTGEKAVAGGWDQANGAAYILADRPIPDGSGWFLRIWADSGDTVPANGSVWVICAKVS